MQCIQKNGLAEQKFLLNGYWLIDFLTVFHKLQSSGYQQDLRKWMTEIPKTPEAMISQGLFLWLKTAGAGCFTALIKTWLVTNYTWQAGSSSELVSFAFNWEDQIFCKERLIVQTPQHSQALQIKFGVKLMPVSNALLGKILFIILAYYQGIQICV